MELQKYSEYAPTAFDIRGLGLSDRQEWFVAPVGRNRDSSCLTESNFHCLQNLLEAIDPEGDTWESHRFSHWACGWVEILLTKPDTKATDAAQEAYSNLLDYPVLDEEDLSRRQFEEAERCWESYGLREAEDSLKDELPEDLWEEFDEDSELYLARRRIKEEGLHEALWQISTFWSDEEGAHFEFDDIVEQMRSMLPRLFISSDAASTWSDHPDQKDFNFK